MNYFKSLLNIHEQLAQQLLALLPENNPETEGLFPPGSAGNGNVTGGEAAKRLGIQPLPAETQSIQARTAFQEAAICSRTAQEPALQEPWLLGRSLQRSQAAGQAGRPGQQPALDGAAAAAQISADARTLSRIYGRDARRY